MTAATASALFAAMALLAALPSVSLLAVSARATAFGFGHGAATALGIVVADLLFILLALFGLAMLVEALDGWFFLIKYLGAAYLIGLGIALWRVAPGRRADNRMPSGTGDGASLRASFTTGLLITLGDQKAVLFYLGFLPAFVDLAALDWLDIGGIAAITVIAVGGVKLAVAWFADRLARHFDGAFARGLNRLAALLMIAAGLYLATTA